MTEHGLAFFDQIRADLAAEGITIRASDWLVEADDAPPDVCPPQPVTEAPFAERAWREHKRGFCLSSGCLPGVCCVVARVQYKVAP